MTGYKNPDLDAVRDQARKAAAYFGRVLGEQKARSLGFRDGSAVIVVAVGAKADVLERVLTESKFLPRGVESVTPPVEGAGRPAPPAGPPVPSTAADGQVETEGAQVVVEPRYHVPSSQTWQGSRGAQAGSVHLHAKMAVKLGRIVRDAGETLCSKKHGTYERPPEGETNLCPGCVEIAERFGVPVPALA